MELGALMLSVNSVNSAPSILDIRELLALYFIIRNNLKVIRTNGRLPVDKGKWSSNVIGADVLKEVLISGKRLSKNINNPSSFGILTGEVNNIVVVDCDVAHSQLESDGIDNLSEVLHLSKEDIFNLAYTVKSASGGYHLYFKCSSANDFKSCTSAICQNVDVRAKGGLIISPYSFRPQIENKRAGWYVPVYDKNYKEDALHKLALAFKAPFNSQHEGWLRQLFPSMAKNIPSLPNAILDILPKSTSQSRPFHFRCEEYPRFNGNSLKYGEALNAIRGASGGERNKTLYKKAFYLYKHWSNVPTLEQDLIQAGRSCGLNSLEIIHTIRSARDGALLSR